jgi:hypothetical protein
MTLNSKTEILDVAPIDFLNGFNKEFLASFPSQLVSEELKDQALDIKFHWVNETGSTATLTGGLNIIPTVLNHPPRNNSESETNE